ncbi:hypothetical protein IKN40_00280 [bacterium]|nr:hypothetical protein [bacterium]
MLTIVNENKLGSHPILVKPQGKHVELDFPAPIKRRFPIENPTVTPKFNSCKPKAYVEPNPKLTPNKDNNYSNNYHKSTTRIEPTTHESAVNAFFRPNTYTEFKHQ